MLSKCANTGCSAPFMYLHKGQLFRWETSTAPGYPTHVLETDSATKRHGRRIEFFWLCDECAPTLTLVFEKNIGVVTRAKTVPIIASLPMRAKTARASGL